MTRIDRLSESLGGVSPLAANKVKDHLEPYVRAFIERAPFAVMATSSADGDCDASPKGGRPGFVKVLDDRTLLVPDVGGNRLFQGYRNLESNLRVGLVFMIPGMDVTVRVNGRVTVLERAEVEALGVGVDTYWTDHNSLLVQGLRIDIDEAYFHCPRAFQFADLWNTATIESNRARSIKDLKTA